MRLEMQDTYIFDPSEKQIAEALASLDENNTELILSKSGQEYLRVSGYPEEGFQLEYHDPGGDVQQTVDDELELDVVFASCKNFASGGHFMLRLAWVEEPKRSYSGVAFGIVMAVVIIWLTIRFFGIS